MSNKKSIFLLSDISDDVAFATEVAKCAELELNRVSNPIEIGKAIMKDEAAIIFADVSSQPQYQAFERALQETAGLFSDKISANAIHFISGEQIQHIKYLIESPVFGHYVYRNYGDPMQAGQQYGRLVRATLQDRAFGLETLLKPGTKIQSLKLKVSTQKIDAVVAMKNFLVAAKFQNRMATAISNAVDETIMNAIFDAPVDALGKQVLASTSRSTSIALEGQHAIEVQVGFDGNYIGITTSDLWGSLDKLKLMQHISKIYTEEEYRVKTSVAGAGIGLATIFRSGGSFFFVSEGGVRTDVTVLFKRTPSYREFKDQFRFISTQFYF